MTDNNFSELKRLQHPPRYLPGLDGLRAISVIGIIIYHLSAQWLPGGFLGVDTFFVISGYLITSLLLFEYDNYGRIDLITFWIKRFKRLIPAMLFVVLISVIYVVFFEPEILKAIKGDAVAALIYVSNWWYIFQDIDYFDQFKPMPLKHLWSLAVEEQFYIFYPLVLLSLLKVLKKKKWVVWTLLIISLLSAAWMFYLSMPDANNSRTYFGTDTRLQTLLIGVIFAFLWPAFKLKAKPSMVSRSIVDILGSSALVGLLVLFVIVNEQQYWLYSGGFYAISLLTLLIIASVVQPQGLLAKAMGNPLFVYIGKRSYSLYLWHFVIITFVHKHFVAGQYPFYVYIIDVVLTLLMAEISYRYIETPFRRYGLRAFYMKEARVTSLIRTPLILAAVVMTTLVLSGQFDSFAKQDQKAAVYKTSQPQEKKEPEPDTVKEESEKSTDTSFEAKKLSPLFIGDSLTVGMGYYLDEHYTTPTIDARVGRTMDEALDVASNYASYNKEGQQVIIQIGTNGDFDQKQIEALIKMFDKADVYVINTTVPRDYQGHVNDLLAKTAKKHKNVTLVDWYSAGIGHTEFFAYDGIHLEHPGIERLVQELDKEIEKNQTK
ncbi:acyltransferase family protein [Staphylococcus sp. 17KM0847]|uniref:acyltransferase family protein n=1 Tax=Staphylococcus sp. 17KM0847 TaxID=2583989 RepID=UPI0015DC8C24|nr:acyltransferase family protein [Staphylococcus sp. 17KM0847]QLK85689.1 acyltransferase [Staphylococcus sp. 17KM0847]